MPSPSSSPTLPIRKRYRGTSELVEDTEDESMDLDIEGEGSEDEGPGSEKEEEASFEDVPPVRVPVQTPPSPEWSFGSLPVSPSSQAVLTLVTSPVITPAATIAVYEGEFLEVGVQLELYKSILHDHAHRLDALPPTLFEGYDKDLRELYNRLRECWLWSHEHDMLTPKRQRCGELDMMIIEDTEDESMDLDIEGEGSEDEGPGSEKEEEAALEGQQQAVPVVDTAANEPLGLGYGALRCHELALGEGSMPSTFEI
nr:hypothetical protein [Tanacetum cinerariifolium]